MKKKLLAVFFCCLILLSFVGDISASADDHRDTVDRGQRLADGILAFQLNQADADSVQEWINGALMQGAGTSSEWYVIALAQNGEYDFSAYQAALIQYLESHTVASASSRQKYALALSATGSADGYISAVLQDSIGKQGVMSWIYGLHLLNNGYSSTAYTATAVIEQLLSLQLSDGGWALMGTDGDADVTAMTVQALAPYYTSDDAVRSAVDQALTCLSELQLSEGDYAAYGVGNPESTAQVIVALSALGIDGESDARFIKNGNTLLDGIEKYCLTDGSFCHSAGGLYNGNATAQSFYAMIAYLRMKDGRGSLYLLDHADPAGVQPAPDSTVSEQTPDKSTHDAKGENGESDSEQSEKTEGVSYKAWVSLSVIGIGGIVCLVLFLSGKRHIKNFIAVLLAVAVAVTVVCVTNISSAQDYYNGKDSEKEAAVGTVTMTIRCDTVAEKADSEYVPADGIVLDVTEFQIESGETVYDILLEAARRYEIQVENNGSAEMVYIAGINYLYELDFGDLSGWVFYVNGASPSVGCGEYELQDGDVIEWHYTCDLGEDVK